MIYNNTIVSELVTPGGRLYAHLTVTTGVAEVPVAAPLIAQGTHDNTVSFTDISAGIIKGKSSEAIYEDSDTNYRSWY